MHTLFAIYFNKLKIQTNQSTHQSHFRFSQPWKMINPMLMVTLAMSVLTGIGCGQVVAGINKFCAEFENFTGNARYCGIVLNQHT